MNLFYSLLDRYIIYKVAQKVSHGIIKKIVLNRIKVL